MRALCVETYERNCNLNSKEHEDVGAGHVLMWRRRIVLRLKKREKGGPGAVPEKSRNGKVMVR